MGERWCLEILRAVREEQALAEKTCEQAPSGTGTPKPAAQAH